MIQGYTCRTCGERHEGLPLSYHADAPAHYLWTPEQERAVRCELSSDQCVIDEEHFFIRGLIEIPILDSDEIFTWGVWTTLSPQNFLRASELWETPGRESEPPCFGWLATQLPLYPDTVNLKTMVHTRPIGQRPYIELEPTDHPLAVDQRQGITWERVQDFAERLLHGEREG